MGSTHLDAFAGARPAEPAPEGSYGADGARAAALRALAVLGTEPEAAYDELAAFAADLLGSDAAAITFLDGAHPWCKARHGTDLPAEPTGELVGVAVRTDDTALVDRGPSVGAWAAVPIHAPRGVAVGALVVSVRSGSTLDDGTLGRLQRVARQVDHLLELRVASRQLAALAAGEDERTALVVTDGERRIRTWSGGAPEIYGWRAEEVLGRPAIEVLGLTSYSWLDQRRLDLASVGHWEGTIVARHRDGSARFVHATVDEMRDADGRRTGALTRHRDRTASHLAEVVDRTRIAVAAAARRGRRAEAFAAVCEAIETCIPRSMAAVARRDGDGTIRVLAAPGGQGEPPAGAGSGACTGILARAVERGTVEMETEARDRPSCGCLGTEHAAELAVPVRDGAGGIVGGVTVLLDDARTPSPTEVAFVRAVADLLGPVLGLAGGDEQAPSVDELTGLPTAAELRARLGRARLAAEGEGQAAVVAVHLDRFQIVNIELGTGAGDAVLRDIARRIERVVDGRGIVGRVEADRFAVLVTDAVDEAAVRRLAQDVLADIRRPIDLLGGSVLLTGSAGIAIDPWLGSSDLLAMAEGAAKEARRLGGDRVVEGSAGDVLHAPSIAARLHKAFAAGELALAYQPQVDLVDGRVTCVEALLRWPHPGMEVPPSVFVAVAEETGLIQEIGAWVLREACAAAKGWGPDGPAVSVNVSARQLDDGRIVDQVVAALADTGLPPDRLRLELTETTLAAGPSARSALRRVADLGVGISVDDFGTGFASLTYLQRFEPDELKIDARFITNCDADPASASIVQAVVALARSLGMRSVAEGVERLEQLRLLQSWGCDAVQGFLFARPMPLEGLALWTANRGDMLLLRRNSTGRSAAIGALAALAGDGMDLPELSLDRLPVGVVLTDADDVIVYANSTAARMMGTEPAVLHGAGTDNWLRADPEAYAQMWEDRRVGRPFVRQVVVARLDGTSARIRIDSRPTLDGGGRFLGAISTMEDLDEREALDRLIEERRLLVADHLGGEVLATPRSRGRDRRVEPGDILGLVVLGVDGRVRWWSERYTDVLGWDRRASHPPALADVVVRDDLPAAVAALAQLLDGEDDLVIELGVRGVDGSVHRMRWDAVAARPRQEIYCFGRLLGPGAAPAGARAAGIAAEP